MLLLVIVFMMILAYREMDQRNREINKAVDERNEQREAAKRRVEEYERERKEAMRLHKLGCAEADIAAKLNISTDRVHQHIHSEDWTNR